MTKNTGELSEESFAFKEVMWKIPNFLDLPRGIHYYVTSPEFRFANATWCLRLYTGEDTTTDVDLVRLQSSVPEHCIHHTVGFVTRRGKEHGSYSYKSIFTDNENEAFLDLYCHYDIMAKKHFLVRDGAVTVFCKMRAKKEETPEAFAWPQQYQNQPTRTELQEASSQTKDLESDTQTELQEASSQTEDLESGTQTKLQEASSQTEVPESLSQSEVEEASTSVQKLQLDYSKLLKSEEDSDVCLKVSDKEFRAHRCILRARSTVFSAMFNYETKERASGEVVIDDLDPDSFPDFLQHVYAGRVELLSSKNVPSLYSAADKYDLQALKSECREYMKRTLSVDTFCDVMTLALRHQEVELLKLAIEFFSKNLAKIIVTAKWQTFSKDYNTEANELLIKALVP